MHMDKAFTTLCALSWISIEFFFLLLYGHAYALLIDVISTPFFTPQVLVVLKTLGDVHIMESLERFRVLSIPGWKGAEHCFSYEVSVYHGRRERAVCAKSHPP